MSGVDWQVLFNIAVGVIGTVFGFAMKVLYDQLKSLSAADTLLAEKLARVEVLVAGQYVTRPEFERALDKLWAHLKDRP